MFSGFLNKLFLLLAFSLSAFGVVPVSIAQAQKTLLNVSYDPTRELYKDFNPVFSKYWQAKTGEAVSFNKLTAVPARKLER
jgi:sulfate transport system substrate-binding protein